MNSTLPAEDRPAGIIRDALCLYLGIMSDPCLTCSIHIPDLQTGRLSLCRWLSITFHLQVTDVKRQASKALKHLRQQLLSLQQQRDELARKVVPFACTPITLPRLLVSAVDVRSDGTCIQALLHLPCHFSPLDAMQTLS